MQSKRIAAALGLVAIVVAIFAARSCGPKPQNDAALPANASPGTANHRAERLRVSGPSGPVNIVVDAGSADANAPAGPDVFFRAEWGGSRMDQLGRNRPQEANPEGPMSFTLDSKGRMYVLDQVNGRVVRIGADGKPESIIPLKQQEAAQDIALTDDGKVAVLDRYSSKSIVMYDEKGNAVGEIPLQGEGLEETGLVTGVFADGKDIYVEKEHGSLMRIGTTDGEPTADRGEVPGRPSRDGQSYLHAGVIDPLAGRMYVSAVDRPTMQHRFTRELRQGAEIHSILLLDSDKLGTIYIATQLNQGGSEVVVLTCIEPLKGFPVGSAMLPVNTLPEESFRDLVVLDEGGVIYSVRTEEGVSYQKYDCM